MQLLDAFMERLAGFDANRNHVNGRWRTLIQNVKGKPDFPLHITAFVDRACGEQRKKCRTFHYCPLTFMVPVLAGQKAPTVNPDLKPFVAQGVSQSFSDGAVLPCITDEDINCISLC